MLILPQLSITAERIFSQLNLIKNKLRNKLNILTIASALAIKEVLKYKIINYNTFSVKEMIKATMCSSKKSKCYMTYSRDMIITAINHKKIRVLFFIVLLYLDM